MRKRYVDQYREQLVNEVIRRGKPITDVAHRGGVAVALLRTWVRDALHEQGVEVRHYRSQLIHALQRKNSELQRRVDLLESIIARHKIENQTIAGDSVCTR